MAAHRSPRRFCAVKSRNGYAIDQVALVLPTSLCSGQIAQRIAAHLNDAARPTTRGISRFVALPHTEGCGASNGENEEHQLRTMMGHLLHPFVKTALLLEHGCERTHNDLLRHALSRSGLDPRRYGYASIQLDGGIDKVSHKVEQWFLEQLPPQSTTERHEVGLEWLSLGLVSTGVVTPAGARALAQVTQAIVGSGGTVVIAENASLLRTRGFLELLGIDDAPRPSLAYGEPYVHAGLHIMATPTDHAVETLTGLGGTGVQIMLGHVDGPPLQGHPMIPLLQFASGSTAAERYRSDFDLMTGTGTDHADGLDHELMGLLCAAASHEYEPRHWSPGSVDFQLTRGMLGVSL